MHKILITGAGKIGSLIACLLSQSKDYDIYLADLKFNGQDVARLRNTLPDLHTETLDVNNHAQFSRFLQGNRMDAVISSLPYYCNSHVAKAAREANIHYFDLTEDVEVTKAVRQIAEGAKSAFVPQCGLAPGFISIVANSLMQHFETLETAKLRVGALPINSSNALQYSLTWSTDGVINEYGNLCHGVENGEPAVLMPLEGMEEVQIDGWCYEAFNTSGGLGALGELYAGKIKTMNYKTLRYPGHCEKMRLLMKDLKLNEDRDTLKRILENAIPKTYQDVVLIYVSVTGHQRGKLIEENYVKKVYPQKIADIQWSAIQVTTASGICAVADMVLASPEKYSGFVFQEKFTLQEFLNNRFGKYYV